MVGDVALILGAAPRGAEVLLRQSRYIPKDLPLSRNILSIKLFTEVKKCFDPDGILNPGVKIALAGQKPIGDVKYDPNLPPLPAMAKKAKRKSSRKLEAIHQHMTALGKYLLGALFGGGAMRQGEKNQLRFRRDFFRR